MNKIIMFKVLGSILGVTLVLGLVTWSADKLSNFFNSKAIDLGKRFDQMLSDLGIKKISDLEENTRTALYDEYMKQTEVKYL